MGKDYTITETELHRTTMVRLALLEDMMTRLETAIENAVCAAGDQEHLFTENSIIEKQFKECELPLVWFRDAVARQRITVDYLREANELIGEACIELEEQLNFHKALKEND